MLCIQCIAATQQSIPEQDMDWMTQFSIETSIHCLNLGNLLAAANAIQFLDSLYARNSSQDPIAEIQLLLKYGIQTLLSEIKKLSFSPQSKNCLMCACYLI